MRRLMLVKQAIADVTKKMQLESKVAQAESSDDKLGWTMRFIRAAEEVRMTTMRRCVAAYPHLRTLADPSDPNVRLGSGLEMLRHHAIELTRTAVLDEMRELHVRSQQLDEMQRTVRRDSIQTRLRRLVPGSTTALKAMCTSDGTVTADPKEMAEALREHWGGVFAAKHIDNSMLGTWLQEVFPDYEHGNLATGLPGTESELWHVQREDIEHAIQTCGDTMPGPDGIPYAAWRMLGPLAVSILHEAATVLATAEGIDRVREAHAADGDNDHTFNVGSLCCLPKKPSGTDPNTGDYFAAENTRPLSIVNTDNRLIANGCRNRWEPIFANWVSTYQQGFLPDRSMLSNVVDVDFEAMIIRLKYAGGGQCAI